MEFRRDCPVKLKWFIRSESNSVCKQIRILREAWESDSPPTLKKMPFRRANTAVQCIFAAQVAEPRSSKGAYSEVE